MPPLPHTLILDLHAQREALRAAQRPRTAGLGCMLLGWVVLGLLVLASYIDPDPPGTVLANPVDSPRRESIAPTRPRREPRPPAPPWP